MTEHSVIYKNISPTGAQKPDLIEEAISLFGKCEALLQKKSTEYSSDTDSLDNFVIGGRIMGCSKEQMLVAYMTKHLAYLIKVVNNYDKDKNKISPEQIEEKIIDIINYLAILRYMVIQNNNQEAEKTKSGQASFDIRLVKPAIKPTPVETHIPQTIPPTVNCSG